MNRLIRSLPEPENWRSWLMVTLVVKVATILLFLGLGVIGFGDTGLLGVWWNDAPTYFDPIESLLHGGDYEPDVRLPGYGAVYMLLRLVTEPPLTYDGLVVLQTLLGAVSMYVLARLVFRLTGSKRMFLLMLVVYVVSVSVQWYDAVMLTESFCASALIFFMDRWLRWHRTGKPSPLYFAGLWLTWAIFLKPVLAPVVGFVLLALWLARLQRGGWMKNALVFLMPLMVVDGAWIIRNALRHGSFAPLTRTLYADSDDPGPELRAAEFVIAFGGDLVWWGDPKAEVRFFNTGKDQLPGHTNAAEIVLPERILTSAYTMDTLRATAAEILTLKQPGIPEDELAQRNKVISARFERWTQAFIQEHPVQYHVLSRLLALRRYVIQTGNPVAYAQTFREMPIHYKALKLFHIGLHYSTMLLGLVGGWLWLRRRQDRALALVPVLLVPFGILIFPIALRFSEHRYLVPFIPFMLLCAMVGLHMRRESST